jgi:hypothetical protein
MALTMERRRFAVALTVFFAWVAALAVTAMLSAYRPAPRPTPSSTPVVPAESGDGDPAEPPAPS